MSLPTFSKSKSNAAKRASAAMSRLRSAVRDALRRPARERRRGRLQKAKLVRAGRETGAVWEVLAGMLLRFGGATSGNDVKLLCDGDHALETIWAAIDRAKHRVWAETYILEPDRVGIATIEALARAAIRGCDVRLLYDALGSPRVTEAFLTPLRDAAGQPGSGTVEIDRFNPVFTWKRRPGLLQRDHRKIIVIDNRNGFCGGMNLSEDYAGAKHGNARFRDCHVQLQGPCVRELALVTWHSLNLVRDVPVCSVGPRSRRAGSVFVQVMSSRGALGRRTIQRAIRLTVRYAVERCWITTPYFLPPLRLKRAMIKAAKRGVDVRVLTAGVSDVPVVRMAAQHVYGDLLKNGVRVFEYFESTLHAKTMTIDGVFSSVGSFNLDTWSHERNLEVKLGVIDRDVARTMEEQFELNLRGSREVLLENWKKRTAWQKFVRWIAYQLMRL